MSTSRPFHLNAFVMSVGHHEAAWRLPESDPRSGTDLSHHAAIARTAERGLFDSLFLADGPALMGDPSLRPVETLEPTVLLTALAGVTERIGLIATASTSYDEPYNLARRFASLDHISGGRAGWNVVTTAGANAAQNFGRAEQPRHEDRYARAEEFLEVALKLFDSWEDDARLVDKAAGRYADPARIHPIEHEGAHFRVRGPLTVPRSAQGRPLLVQAGSSEAGRRLAARYAEAVFTAQQTLADGQDFYLDLKRRALRAGRNPEELKILPGLVPVIGGTEAEAREHEEELDRLILPAYALRQLATILEVPVEILELDRELPQDLPDQGTVQGQKSRSELVIELARRERLTVRQLLGRLGGGRGHRTLTGTPEQIADSLQEWFENGAADGFNIMPPTLPGSLDAFVDHVVPILQRRGLFRIEYSGTTLRDHYGLDRPENRFAAARSPLEGVAS